MYCPNCGNNLVTLAAECARCGAQFGEGSVWQPVKFPPAISSSKQLLSRRPKVLHASHAVPIFALLGPLLGLALFWLQSDFRGSIIGITHPFVLVGAFTIGGAPALVSGLLYAIISLAFVAIFKRAIIGAIWGATIGATGSGAAAVGCFALLFAGTAGYPAKTHDLVILSVLSGSIVGLVCGWLLPVGRSPASAEVEANPSLQPTTFGRG